MTEPIVTELTSRFRGTDWFPRVVRYWKARFLPIEARLENTFRYVEMSAQNRSTFSYEYASILRDCGSVFGSVVDVFVRNSRNESRPKQYTFAHYRKFLTEQVPNIHEQTVEVRVLFPHGIIFPFENLENEDGVPKWWNGYNKVKHNEMGGFSEGNLENCIHALGALALLGHAMNAKVDESLFVYIGDAVTKPNRGVLFLETPMFQPGKLW
jgi:hypothetical protein